MARTTKAELAQTVIDLQAKIDGRDATITDYHERNKKLLQYKSLYEQSLRTINNLITTGRV